VLFNDAFSSTKFIIVAWEDYSKWWFINNEEGSSSDIFKELQPIYFRRECSNRENSVEEYGFPGRDSKPTITAQRAAVLTAKPWHSVKVLDSQYLEDERGYIKAVRGWLLRTNTSRQDMSYISFELWYQQSWMLR
jgi:hypothetical protein